MKSSEALKSSELEERDRGTRRQGDSPDAVQQVMRTMGGHPGARVPVKHCKPRDILLLVRNADHCGVGVLHLNPPALHGGQAILEAAPDIGLVILFSFWFVKKGTHSCQERIFIVFKI